MYGYILCDNFSITPTLTVNKAATLTIEQNTVTMNGVTLRCWVCEQNLLRRDDRLAMIELLICYRTQLEFILLICKPNDN